MEQAAALRRIHDVDHGIVRRRHAEHGQRRCRHQQKHDVEEQPVEHVRHLAPVGHVVGRGRHVTRATRSRHQFVHFRSRLVAVLDDRAVVRVHACARRPRTDQADVRDYVAQPVAQRVRVAPTRRVRGLARRDAQRLREVAQHEDARPRGHGARAVLVVQVEDEDGEADGHCAEGHRARQVDD